MAEKIQLFQEEAEPHLRHPRVTVRQFRANLAEVIRFAARGGRAIITKHGEQRAGVVSLEEVNLLDGLNDSGLRQALVSALSNPAARAGLRGALVQKKN